jgi:hypothetical protein
VAVVLKVKVRGNTNKTESFLRRRHKLSIGRLEYYGQLGVDALSSATPVRTGLTAASWSYEIIETENTTSIVWKNSNVVDGYPIAMILQYGHGTRNGGYVQGIDYINPALQPIFDKMSEEAWLEVTR